MIHDMVQEGFESQVCQEIKAEKTSAFVG